MLRNPSCLFWVEAQKVLINVLRENGVDAIPEVILIDTDEKARERKFFGSPHITINGEDIDPMAKKMTNYHVGGCRLYLYEGKVYNYPPPQMILKA